MALSTEKRDDVVAYRKEKSIFTLKEAEGIASMEFWSLCANRLYYSAYYACTALLIKHGHTTTTHNGVMRMMGKEFFMTGILPKCYSDLLQRLFSMRHTGDYDDCFDWSEEDIVPLFTPVREFIEAIFKLLESGSDIEPV
jgi:uncharacterized protein (UPF0332 family)